MTYWAILVVIIFNNSGLLAQIKPQVKSTPEWEIRYTQLYSTHATQFIGLGISSMWNISEKHFIGVGLDQIRNNYHPDNGWELTNLHFTPFYLKYRYKILPKNRFSFLVFADLGISFNAYNKRDPFSIPVDKKINEKGFYSEIGIISSPIAIKRIYTRIGVGIKNYNLSTNDLDVNPHGLSFQACFGLLSRRFRHL